MFFEVVDHVPYSLDIVYSTMRDKLPELAPYLPDVKSIECIERQDLGCGGLKLVNHWRAEDKIPGVLKKFISADQLGWIDHAEWDDGKMSVKWRLEMMFFKEYVDVHGENFFTGDDGNTTVRLTGNLNLHLSRHPLIPKLLAKSFTKQVERFVLALIKPNLVKVNRGIEKHLADSGRLP